MSERPADFQNDDDKHDDLGEDVPMREYSIDEEKALEENLEDDERENGE